MPSTMRATILTSGEKVPIRRLQLCLSRYSQSFLHCECIVDVLPQGILGASKSILSFGSAPFFYEVNEDKGPRIWQTLLAWVYKNLIPQIMGATYDNLQPQSETLRDR